MGAEIVSEAASADEFGLAASCHQEAVWVDGALSTPWKVVLSGALAMMFGPSALLAGTFAVFAAGLEGITGWSHSSVSYAATMMSTIALCTSPFQGFVSDKLGGRRFALYSMPLFALGLMSLQFMTSSLTTFYIGCAIVTVAGLGIWPVSYMKVVAGWFEKRIGIAVGVVMAGLGVSTALYPILFGWGFRNIGWSGTYMAVGGFVLLVVWPSCIRWLKEAHLPVKSGMPRAASSSLGPDFRAAMRSRVFHITLPLFFTLGLINATLLVHGIAIMKSDGVPLKTALAIQSFVGVGVIIGRLGTGWLLDRTSARVVGVAMFLMAVGSFLILSSPFAASLAVLSACLGGLVIGAEFDLLGVLIRRHFGTFVFGRVYGIVFATFQIGGAVGSGALAFVLAQSGSFLPGLEMLVIASLICAVVFPFIGKDPSGVDRKEMASFKARRSSEATN